MYKFVKSVRESSGVAALRRSVAMRALLHIALHMAGLDVTVQISHARTGHASKSRLYIWQSVAP